MKIFSAPRGVAVPAVSDLQLILYGQPDRHADGARSVGSAGAAIETRIQRLRYAPAQEHGTFFRLPSLSSWRILVFIGREVLMAGLAKSI